MNIDESVKKISETNDQRARATVQAVNQYKLI